MTHQIHYHLKNPAGERVEIAVTIHNGDVPLTELSPELLRMWLIATVRTSELELVRGPMEVAE